MPKVPKPGKVKAPKKGERVKAPKTFTAAPPAAAETAAAPEPTRASAFSPEPRRSFVDRVLDAVAGARLCYGDPVHNGERTVIPVSRVRVAGGGGFGRSNGVEEGTGGGGGGWVEAQPIGFVELGPEGTRYVEIPDPERTQRMLKAGASALATLAAGWAGAKRLRGGSKPRSRGLLNR